MCMGKCSTVTHMLSPQEDASTVGCSEAGEGCTEAGEGCTEAGEGCTEPVGRMF